ncbi:alpha/beta hydrolase [Mycobacterium sp. CBMA293]|uniref:alpha/beta hydrolase n=1 Tax=unclassified Mycolicibacterium TaxID=2636767 RepID=UPI0012DE88C6|nr:MULTISPECIES: alpha/beta hydrolase [unclassified Mycolicibacterium]MUL44961.1 alpha/beta hydrolase [Mycolicibacterium sp. CBMA 360]MUL57930.1 alpha/beta hydrolase [Mycolicibacterium sp. CBMA 335]MUL72621.1 alpha/beta hydrolase [Mycolicibacterium sp. CBMA 311]MUL95554.1 alpha/beta hydrolase [Mycolicibacterium sp. CBMA 230]MUM07361.1 alpha/beta hydrolase [Mycolicibacterium sp. CBMA 213]
MPIIPTVDGFDATVDVSGPDNATTVVLLATQQASAAYGALCELLHTASLRTVVIDADNRLSVNSVVGILDTLGVRWALLFADRGAGDLPWRLAATRLDRFTAFVIVDSSHPRATDTSGEACPPVEISTTAVVTTADARAQVQTGQRFIYGEFRMAEMLDGRPAEEFTAQLANEIVLRSSTW